MKKIIGQVVSAKSAKTAIVTTTRFWEHPLYHKKLRRTKKYPVHDEIGVSVGDQVLIQECRPISKTKRFKIIKKIS